MDPSWALSQAKTPVAKAAPFPSLLPEIIPHVAAGLEGLGLPRTSILLPTGHPGELKGCPCPEASCLACVGNPAGPWEALAPAVLRVLGLGDEHLPSPTAFLSFCLIPRVPWGGGLEQGRSPKLAEGSWRSGSPHCPVPYRLPVFDLRLPPPSEGLWLCVWTAGR